MKIDGTSTPTDGGVDLELNVELKKVYKNAKIPTRGSDRAAGVDVYAYFEDGVEAVVIYPGETHLIKTGISLAIPDGFYATIVARSGISIKRGLAPANKYAVIDSDYRGEIIVALHNHGNEPQTIFHDDRIAQMLFLPYYKPNFNIVDELSETERGDGGFGSTGMK